MQYLNAAKSIMAIPRDQPQHEIRLRQGHEKQFFQDLQLQL